MIMITKQSAFANHRTMHAMKTLHHTAIPILLIINETFWLVHEQTLSVSTKPSSFMNLAFKAYRYQEPFAEIPYGRDFGGEFISVDWQF